MTFVELILHTQKLNYLQVIVNERSMLPVCLSPLHPYLQTPPHHQIF